MKRIEQVIISIEVAEMVGKAHNELLKDIRRYVSQFNEGNLPHVDFFEENTYTDSKGELRPCYLVTKKGCEFIGNKLTGIKGTEFTAKYINRFHDMEEIIHKPMSTSAQIQLLAQGNIELEQKIDEVSKDLQTFKQDMPILGIEEGKITSAVKRCGVRCLGGKNSAAYQDKSLRGKIYSDIYYQLKREFGVTSYKAIKRSQCDIALEIIESYELPYILEEQVKDSNGQMNLAI